MESKKEFNHPYWQIYSCLIALRNASRKQVNKELPEMMELAQLRKKDRLFIHALMLLPWFNVKMVEEIFFLRLREFFAYSVLSPEILELIAQYAPLVELAAGNGYNAWLLEQMGVDITAIDAFPVEEGKNWFFHTNVLGFPTGAGSSFTKVLKGDAEALVNYPNHALLLCWPPLNKMAANSLSHFSGKHIIFIGNKVVCANTAFYKELDTQWKLEKSIATGSFDTCHKEVLEVYCRK